MFDGSVSFADDRKRDTTYGLCFRAAAPSGNTPLGRFFKGAG